MRSVLPTRPLPALSDASLLPQGGEVSGKLLRIKSGDCIQLNNIGHLHKWYGHSIESVIPLNFQGEGAKHLF